MSQVKGKFTAWSLSWLGLTRSLRRWLLVASVWMSSLGPTPTSQSRSPSWPRVEFGGRRTSWRGQIDGSAAAVGLRAVIEPLVPPGVDSCSRVTVKMPRGDRWQPARGFATGQGAGRVPSDLLPRVLGTLRSTHTTDYSAPTWFRWLRLRHRTIFESRAARFDRLTAIGGREARHQ